VAARLPAIRLSGSAGYAASTIEELFDTSIWNLAGSLAEPLIDGGRKRAEVDRSKAVRDERLARAEEVLLTAVREVEDAWSGERGQRETAELAAKRRDAARVAHEQARSRYGKGLSDYLVTLISQDRLRVAERELVAARRQLMAYRIQLWRALGAPGLERAVSPPVDGGRAGLREGSKNDE
jgi:outer membrane protein TolC